MYRISLNVHTCHSYDCQSDLNNIIKICIRKNITHILISDHDTIEGALKLKNIAITHGITVIVGEEVTSEEGVHIIGVNLKKHINRLSACDVIDEILNQGGILIFLLGSSEMYFEFPFFFALSLSTYIINYKIKL